MVLKSIGKLFNDFLKSLENKYIGTVVSLFLVLFGGLAAPEIPNFVKKMLNNDLFRLIYAFLLTYIAEKNIQIALIAAVVFLVLSGLVANEEVKEAFEEALENISSGKNEKDAYNDYLDEALKIEEETEEEQEVENFEDDLVEKQDWDPDDEKKKERSFLKGHKIISYDEDNHIGYIAKLGKLVFFEKTKYSKIEIYKSKAMGKILMIDGEIQFCTADEFIYHEMIAHVPLAFLQNTKKVLILGGGDGGTLTEILKHKNIKKVDLVEIDERIVDVSKMYFPRISKQFDNAKVNVFIANAFDFIKGNMSTHPKYYDMIIQDCTDYDPDNPLYMNENIINIKKFLKVGGIYVENFIDLFQNINDSDIYNRYLFVKKNFKYCSIYHCGMPYYLGSMYGFIICSDTVNFTKMNINWKFLKKIETKYYNKDIHIASFALPNYLKTLL